MNITAKTCATCYHFNSEPWHDLGNKYPAGCGEAYEAVASVDPLTGRALTYRERIASDPACTAYLTEQEGIERDAASWAKHEADQLRDTGGSPEFDKAVAKCLHLDETLGKGHPETIAATAHALSLASQDFHDFMTAKMRELDLVPEAFGYTADGQAVFRIEDIAAKLGMSLEEAQDAMQAFDEMDLSAMVIDPATIHRVQ